jgi:outer membrane lipoprotein SlyB
MKTKSTLIVSLMLAAAVNVSAGQIDGGAVVGSMVGAGVGSAVGSATGGKNGAIIGGGVGGALGAAVGSKETTRSTTQVVTREKVVYVDQDREHHDNGRHEGHHKHHDRD